MLYRVPLYQPDKISSRSENPCTRYLLPYVVDIVQGVTDKKACFQFFLSSSASELFDILALYKSDKSDYYDILHES